MLQALLPYLPVPRPSLFGFPLQLFAPLVGLGVVLGRVRGLAYCERRDIDRKTFDQFFAWMIVAAFMFAHWVTVIFYVPEELARNPWILLEFWNGLSSVGGFFGAVVGAVLYLRVYRARWGAGAQPMLIYVDSAVFGLLIGWCFGRFACTLVHDHPGKVVAEGTFFAFGPWPDGSWRYDLGFIEFLFTIVLAAIVHLVVRWDRLAPGRLTGWVLVAYAPFRFALDTLRTEEPVWGVLSIPDLRYFGLTPAQWFTVGFGLVGVWLALVRKPKPRDLEYARQSARPKVDEAVEGPDAKTGA